MDFSNLIPIKVDSKWNDIYLSAWNKITQKKEFHKISNFKHYYYIGDVTKPIIQKEFCQKTTSEKSWTVKKEAQANQHTYEADIPFERRFLIDTFGSCKALEEFPLTYAIIDIENWVDGKIDTFGRYPITAISMYDTKSKRLATFAWHEDEQYKDKENFINVAKTEGEMIDNFVKYYNIVSPDVLTGWNFTNYDLPNICHRFKKFDKLQGLSPVGIVEPVYNRNEFKIFHVSCIDYMALYDKFAGKHLFSKALNAVAMEELGEGKVKYNGDLNNLWKTNIKKFIEYNRKDVELIVRINEKVRLLDLANEIRNIGIVNMEDVLHNSFVIDNLIVRLLNMKGFIVNSKFYGGTNDDKIAGAYVKEPEIGIYDWIIDEDFTSLYPSIMINLNISPETKDMAKGELIAGNGVRFSKKQKGIIPQILEWFFKDRQNYKDKMKVAKKEKDYYHAGIYNAKQNAFKVIMNSMYGFLAFQSSRFYDKDLGEAVTLTGQNLIKYSIDQVEKMGYHIVTSDTDSILITVPELKSTEEGRALGLKISDDINSLLKDYCKKEFNIDNCSFNLKQEIVARRGMFLVKKHYVLWETNQEGVDVDHMNFKGVQIVRGDTPDFTKAMLRTLYDILLKERDLSKAKKLINEYRANITDVANYESIGLPTSLKDQSDYKVETIALRASRIWDAYYGVKNGKTFDSISKGRLYYLKEYPKTFTVESTKDPVILIPEGEAFPSDLEIDFEHMRTRIIDGVVEDVEKVIYMEESKELAKKYAGVPKEEVMKSLYEQIPEKNKIKIMRSMKIENIVDKSKDILRTDLTFKNYIGEPRNTEYLEYVRTRILAKEF